MINTNRQPISEFIETYFLHFNAASLVDAAKGYETQLEKLEHNYKLALDIQSGNFEY